MARKLKEPPPFTPEVVSAIEAALAGSPLPLTATGVLRGLKGPLRRPAERIEEFLKQRVDLGTVWEFSPQKSQPRFGDRPPEAYFRDALARELVNAKSAQDAQSLLKKLQKLFPEISPAEFQRLLEEAIRAERVFRHPPASGKDLRKFKYSTRPPALDPYLKKAVREIRAACDRVAPASIAQDRMFLVLAQMLGWRPPAAASVAPASSDSPAPSELTSANLNGRLDRAVSQVEPAARTGALVFFRDLRRVPELADLSPAEFNLAILQWNRERPEIALHAHDHAALLSAEDREALVTDGQGRFYIGLAYRQPASSA